MMVEPGKSLTINKPAQNGVDLQILNDIRTIIRGATPLVNALTILNNTKGCVVRLDWYANEMRLVVTNPEDEVFKLDTVGDVCFSQDREVCTIHFCVRHT